MDSRPVTSVSRSRYRSSVARAWFARDSSEDTSSRTCFWSPTYSVTRAIDSDTEITGAPVCSATRSAVRCLVPVSLVGIEASGTRWTLA